MRALTGKALFAVEDVEYRWEDASICVALQNGWTDLRRPTDEGLALAAAAPDAEQDDDVEAAAEEFRHARGLLAADDLERWLEERDVSVDAWWGHLARTALRIRESGAVRAARAAPDALAEPLRVDLICSGEIDRIVRDLAGRAAGAAAAGSGKRRRATDVTRLPKELPAVLGMSADAVSERAARLARLDEPFARFVDAATVAASIAHAVEMNTAGWTRFRVRMVVVDDLDRARELAMLVREDGVPLRDAAERAGSPAVDERRFYEDFPPAVRERVFGARRGEIIGPFEAGEGSMVIEVVDRTEPSARDRAVAARAADSVLHAALDREIGARVRWIDRSKLTARI